MFAITPGRRSIFGWVGGTRTPIDLVRSQEPIRSATGALEAARESNPDLLIQNQASYPFNQAAPKKNWYPW